MTEQEISFFGALPVENLCSNRLDCSVFNGQFPSGKNCFSTQKKDKSDKEKAATKVEFRKMSGFGDRLSQRQKVLRGKGSFFVSL